MKNFVQKHIFLFFLAIIFNTNLFSQSRCSSTAEGLQEAMNQLNNQFNEALLEISNLEFEINNLELEKNNLEVLKSSLQDKNTIILTELVNALKSEHKIEDSFVEINQGWNMFGYPCIDPKNALDAFSVIKDDVVIVKDELGLSYLPEWNFNALGNLRYGKGYQVKALKAINGFQFCPKISPVTVGCDDPTAFNYNLEADVINSYACIPVLVGCIDNSYLEFDSNANTNDASLCLNLKVFGCTNPVAVNFNAAANVEDDSCIVYGCTDSNAQNYDFAATDDDGSCYVNGCMDPTAFNYNSSATVDSILVVQTYLTNIPTNSTASYSSDYSDGVVDIEVESGSYVLYGSYSSQPNSDVILTVGDNEKFSIESLSSSSFEEKGNDSYSPVPADVCFYEGVDAYNEMLNEYSSYGVIYPEISSCDDILVELGSITASNGFNKQFTNFDSYLDIDYSQLKNIKWLRISTINSSFNMRNLSLSNLQAGSSCIPVVEGCTDSSMCNYNSSANTDDDSCYNNDLGCGCDVPLPEEGYNCQGNLMIAQIGDTLDGGLVFFIDESGQHGLIADFEDLGFMAWQDAVNSCDTSSRGGYDDWFMPSFSQIELMINELALDNNNLMGLDFNHEFTGYYWSSTTKVSGEYMWVHRTRVVGGETGYVTKTLSTYPDNSFVRAVREF